MKPLRTKLPFLTVLLALSACAVIGPDAIHNGRLAYTEAILATNNQQLLLAIVRERYSERSELLMVSSVTANIRIAATTGVQTGFGEDDDYRGNLVPFSAGLSYEENPTISYTPVNGQNYTDRLLSPLPLKMLAQLTTSMSSPAPGYRMMVSTVNSIRNREYGSQDEDLRFEQFVDLATTLTRQQSLYWAGDPQQEGRLVLVVNPRGGDAARDLLVLLGLSVDRLKSKRVLVPVYLAHDARNANGIGFRTRSIYDLVEILAGAVDVPPEHVDIAGDYPSPGALGRTLHVRWSAAQPETALVAVPFRAGWFYIDERDLATKRYFRMVTALWSAAIADSAGLSSAPVLTVPVSR